MVFAEAYFQSAYEMKSNCRLFERLFKILDNDAFPFEISVFVLKILTFLYYGNQESDDVTNCANKMVKY